MTVAPTPLHSRRTPQRHQLIWLVALVLAALGIALLIQHDVFRSSSSSNGVRGSGNAAQQTRALARFSRVELAGSNNVTVRLGDRQSVVVHADDNLLARVTTRIRRDSLVIGTTGNFTTRSPMRVEVIVRSLDALTLSGSGVISAENIHASRLDVTLSGSGVLRATGAVSRLDVSLNGSGDTQLDKLVAVHVRAIVNGSGRIRVDATNSLDASVAGTGAIIYSGNPPHVTASITGTGAVAPA